MKKIISFLAGDGGNFHFVNPIINYLNSSFEIRVHQESVYDIKKLQKILNESDLVWYEWGNGPVVQASQLSKKAKTICRVHRYEILGNEIKGVNWKNIDNLIFVNKDFYNLFKKLVNNRVDEETSVSVIPNPINEIESFKGKSRGYNIAYISRFNSDKNPALMIQVLQKLVEADPKYKIFMAGAIQDVQLYLYCMHLLKELNLQKNFIYEGTINNINEWLRDKNYILSTSIVEAHPVSISEGMMLGIKPVIHNSFGRLGEVFDDKYLFNTPDEAVKIITEKDYNSAGYHQLVCEKFGAGVIMPEIKNLIDTTINSEKLNIPDPVAEYPFITIGINTFNRAGHLREAIETSLNQEGNFEIVIIDDCSTDNTRQIVENYSSEKIRYFKNENNLGRPKSRNRCIKEAKGDYILWLGDDDLLMPGVLQEYSEVILQNPAIDVIYGNVQAFDEETGEDLVLFSANDYSSSSEKLLMNLIGGSGITDGGSLIKKSLYESYGYYDEEYLRAQDNEFWTRIALKANFYKHNKTIYRYRKHKNNISFSSFVDSSYESKTIRKILGRYPLAEIFPGLKDEEAFYFTANGLYNFGDFYNCINFLKRCNTSSLQNVELLIDCLINMGDTESAEKNIKTASVLSDHYVVASLKKIESITLFRKEIGDLFLTKNYPVIKDKIQSFINDVGFTFDAAAVMAKFFEELGEASSALDFISMALCFKPADDECFNIALRFAKTEGEKENIKNMRDRLLENIPLFSETKSEESINDLPLISVIIPTFNRKDKLLSAVGSVQNQTYKNFELIIVNDAGEDVGKIVEDFSDSRISYKTHTQKKGTAAARNTGINAAIGKYIALLDDDDLFYPHHLQTAIDSLNDETKIIYTDAVRITFTKSEEGYKQQGSSVPYSVDYHRDKLLVGNISPVNCFVFEKSLTEKAGLFDESLPVLEDWEFWLRLSSLSDFKHIKENTVQVNWYNDGSTLTSSKQEEFDRIRNIIYKKHEDEINRIPNMNEIASEFSSIWGKDNNGSELLVSIIALSYNQVEYTKAFIDSVFQNTNISFELIIIDNNSNEETVKYLTELSKSDLGKKSGKQLKIIFNNVNLGFPKGINQGIKEAAGNFILIANNDIVVTKGWLNRMIDAANRDPLIGIVGPISNSVSGVQFDKKAVYSSIDEMHAYADNIAINNSGKSLTFPRVAFLCTLIKKEVIEKIGGLDERFSPGNFEDDDFCLRAQLAGFKTVIAGDVFIHHFGSKSFTADGVERYQDHLDRNKKLFISKWGADPEDIWLRGKPADRRNLVFPVYQNLFLESFERAKIHLEDKEYHLAQNYLKVAIDNFDNTAASEMNIAEDSLFNLYGNIALLLNEFETAKEYFELALNKNPQSSYACLGLGEVFCGIEMFEQAKLMFEWNLKFDPLNEKGFNSLIECNKKLNFDPYNFSVPGANHKDLKIEESESLIQDEKLEDAAKLLMEILSENPFDLDALNNLSVINILNGNNNRAISIFERIQKIDPQNELARENLVYLNSIIQ